MAQDQKVTLTFKLSDDTEKQVAFTVPGGKDGSGSGGSIGYGEPTIITDPTDVSIVEAKYNDLLNDRTITKGVAYHYAQVTSGGEALEYAGQGVMISAIPAGEGVIATYAGVISNSNRQALRVRYSDSTNMVLLVENTLERTLTTDATLTGNGDINSVLGVQVSADLQNELTVLKPENSDTPGLFARPISAMLFAADDSIVKTSSYQGNPKNAAINVRISARKNNALKLIPDSDSTTERGLYVPPVDLPNWTVVQPASISLNSLRYSTDQGVYNFAAVSGVDGPVQKANGFPVDEMNCSVVVFGGAGGTATQVCYVPDQQKTYTRDWNGGDWYPWRSEASLKRGTGGGNFSFGYPDNKSAKTACGKMGTGVYWKVTVSLDNAGAGNVAVIPKVWTNNIPCMEDGTLVPYQFVVDYVESRNNAIPSAAVWLICMGVPTHTMDITSGALTKLQRADNGLTNGLDDLYPLAPDGEYAQEPAWRREYFYDAFKA